MPAACLYKNNDFIARKIKIKPPEISRYFDGKFFIKFPNPNPKIDIKNETIPITNADKTSGVRVRFKLAPETRASILVATPRLIRHLKSMQQTSSFLS